MIRIEVTGTAKDALVCHMNKSIELHIRAENGSYVYDIIPHKQEDIDDFIMSASLFTTIPKTVAERFVELCDNFIQEIKKNG